LSVATAGGDVPFKSFGDHAVVTWRRVSLGGSERCTAQCTLYPNGRVVFAHAGALPTAPVVIGVVHGDGVDGPEIVDVSTDPDWSTTGTHGWYWVSFPGTLTPRVFTSAPTATGQAGAVLTTACMPATSEVYGSGCPTAGSFWQQGDVSDLADTSYRLTPNAAGGYTVTAAAASLDPQIGTATGIGDDALFTVNLPFAFVHPSNPAGSTAVDVCSNGYLWLDAGATTSAAYAPIASNLFAEPARLALLWTDLNPTDPLSDDVYVDVRPDRAVITWNAVVEYGRPTPLTAQCVLFADGSITWCFGSQLDAWTPAITGYSAGNGAASVAAQALAATVPFATSAEGQAPLALSTAWTPVLGESIAMTVENVPTTPALGLTLAGFLPQSVDLGSYGAPGCTILNSLEVSVATVHGASFGTVEFPIPSNPVMLGVPLYLQHAAVSPGTNALGLVVSNGLRLVVGEF
ncbi:MAG: hypothetical protein KDE27_08605, partial [Planctomycetes bacterium]|nr:hypothetical protein [Planctomycetota bacterium]